MRDIAARAGVSHTAVSFVLSDKQRTGGSISEATKARILAAAAELGYRRDELRRATIAGKSRMIGFLTATNSNESVARMLAGAVDEAEKWRYTVKIMHLANCDEVDDEVLDRCLELRLAGAIGLYLHRAALEKFRAELARHDVHLAVADDNAPQAGIHVLTDYDMGMEQLVAHLKGLGHQRIALLGGSEDLLFGAQARENAFLRAMEKHSLEILSGFLSRGHWKRTEEPGFTDREVRALLERTDRPTALVAVSDQVAMRAVGAALNARFRVPRDLSVASLGNVDSAEFFHPALTAVAQPFNEIGRVTMRHLIERIESGVAPLDAPAILETLPTRLIVRDSTARAPQPERARRQAAALRLRSVALTPA